MNNGRIWCVVNPTVGLPLFLGSVTVIALTVHFAVLNNTTWMGAYWGGGAKAKAAAVETAPAHLASITGSANAPFVVDITPAPVKGIDGATAFVVTILPRAEPTTTAELTPPNGPSSGTGLATVLK